MMMMRWPEPKRQIQNLAVCCSLLPLIGVRVRCRNKHYGPLICFSLNTISGDDDEVAKVANTKPGCVLLTAAADRGARAMPQ